MFKKKMGTLLILCLLSVSEIFAQADTLDGPEPPPQTPINNLLVPMFILAIFIGGYFFYHKNRRHSEIK